MDAEDAGLITINLDPRVLTAIDKFRDEWGLRSRADIVERILKEVLAPDLS